MLNRTTILMNKGQIPLFKLKSGNFLVALVSAKSFSPVFIIKTGKTLTGYVDTADSVLEDRLIKVLEDLKECYPGLTKVYSKTKPYAATADDMVITEVCKPNLGNQLPLSYYSDKLAPLGFDTSALFKTLEVSSELDYTFCQDDEEAKAVLADNASIFSYFTPNMANWPANVQLAFNGVKQGKYSVVIFKGPAGTGKSILARQFAYLMNAPLLTYQVTDSTTKDDLFGSPIVNTDPKVEGQFVFAIGPVLKTAVKNWQQLLDEINMGQANCVNCLNQIFDDTNVIEHDGKHFKKAKNPVYYLTMNEGYEGTNGLSPALKSRTIVVDVPRLSQQEFANRLELYVTNKLKAILKTAFYKQLYSFTDYMQETSKKYAENVEFCIRNAQKLCATILTKSCSLQEFTAAVYMSYVDFLSMDNDNTEQVNTLKSSSEMTSHIQKLYDLYDYKVAKTVDATDMHDLDDIIWEDETATTSSTAGASASSSAISTDEDLDELDNYLNSSAASVKETAEPDDENEEKEE